MRKSYNACSMNIICVLRGEWRWNVNIIFFQLKSDGCWVACWKKEEHLCRVSERAQGREPAHLSNVSSSFLCHSITQKIGDRSAVDNLASDWPRLIPQGSKWPSSEPSSCFLFLTKVQPRSRQGLVASSPWFEMVNPDTLVGVHPCWEMRQVISYKGHTVWPVL